MLEQLQEQIKVVVEARQKAATLNEVKKLAYEAFEKLNKELFDKAADAGQLTAEAEVKLRNLTLQAYAETGDKAPAVGVSVKLFTVLNYDSDEAKEWAVEHQVALKLDTTTFEKIAKVDKPSFVTMSEEPRAQIARNLEVHNA